MYAKVMQYTTLHLVENVFSALKLESSSPVQYSSPVITDAHSEFWLH